MDNIYIKGNFKRSIYRSDNGYIIGLFKIKASPEIAFQSD